MAEEQEKAPEAEEGAEAAEAASEPAGEPASEPAASGGGDVEEGKTFAILSYVVNFLGLPFFLVPLIMRNNSYSLYHAKQCLIIALATVVGSVVSSILMAVCIGAILMIVVIVFWYVWNIVGLINACKGEAKPVPVIGKWGEDWFKGITLAN